MKKNNYYIIAALAIVGLLFFLFSQKDGAHITESSAQEPVETGYVNERRSIVELLNDPEAQSSIPLEEIFSGGVPKDGIPSIEKPIIVPIEKSPEWINVGGDGIAVTIGDVSRFYPYQVLVSHEIVNDIIEDTPVLVTYCPLCYTGIVFDPVIDGAHTLFGVSGFLWESNLLMYNRSAPESLWSQAAGEAVFGQATGTVLDVLNFDIMTQEKFAERYPEGEIVIGDQENPSTYTRIPYGGNLRDIDSPFGASGKADERLERNDIVMGLEVGDVKRAYHVAAVISAQSFEEEVGGRTLKITYDTSLGVVRIFDITDGKEERLSPIPSFWFSWASTHPGTTVYK